MDEFDLDETFLSSEEMDSSSSNNSHHKRSVTLTEDDFMAANEGSPKRRTHGQARPCKLPPADKSIFDTVVSPGSDEGPIEHSQHDILEPTQDWFMANDEVPDNTLPLHQNMFDDEDNDAIRIPALDSHTMPFSSHGARHPGAPSISRSCFARDIKSGNEQVQKSAQLNMLEKLKRVSYTKAQKRPEDCILGSEITDLDVICERGGKSNRHAGTKRYRGMIEKHKPKYKNLAAKNDKTNVSRGIIKEIQNAGGRFLKKDEETGNYFVLSAVETTKKVSHTIHPSTDWLFLDSQRFTRPVGQPSFTREEDNEVDKVIAVDR